MATAAPHVKLLRQLASAKDDYLSGAFDISWDGAKATLYLVFGRPSHAVFDTDQAQIEGEAAIDALLAELPRTFAVSDWRRAMSPQETLSISIDELAGPFVRLAGSYADDPVTDENPEWWSSDDSSPDLAFGLADFPLLPGGRPLWAETSPENVNLAERLAELPPSILILTGAKLRAAAVVSGGDIIDAVWIDDEDQARGEAAGMAILGATKGTLAGYALDDPRVAEALTMLWRLPLAVDDIEMAWLDPASMLAAFRADGLDRVLVIDAPVRGIALFSRGGLVAVYSETQRSAVASPERLRSLLSQARGRLTVMERKPRPVAAGAAPTIPSAIDFFSVAVPEQEAEAADAAPPDAVAEEAAPAVAEPDSGDATVSEPASAYAHPFLREHPIVPATQESATEADQGAVAYEATGEAEPSAENAAETVAQTDLTAEPSGELTPETESAAATTDAEPEAAAAEPVAEHATDFVGPEAAGETDAPPPPPPGDTGVAAVDHDHAPPPPAPEAAVEPARKTKRPWWAFGTRRKSATQAPSDADKAVAEAAAAEEAAEAASSAGWAIRQPDASAPPPWSRPRDYTLADTDDAAAVTEAPPPAPDPAAGETTTHETTPAWSVIEPGTSHALWPAPVSTETEPDVQEADPVEAPVDEIASAPAIESAAEESTEAEAAPAVEPDAGASPSAVEAAGADDTAEPEAETAGEHSSADKPAAPAAPAWSAREVIADSVSWYKPPQHPDAGADASTDAVHESAADSEPGASSEGDETPAEDEQEPRAATEHYPVGDGGHETAAKADDDVAAKGADEPAAEAEHGATAGDERDHDHVAADHLEPIAAAHPEADTPRDFWAEFATPDHDEPAEDAEHQPEPLTAADATSGTGAHTEEASEAASEPAAAPEDEPAAEDAEPSKPKSSERTFAPWNWPLAEAEVPVAQASVARPASIVDEAHEHAGAEALDEAVPQDTEPDTDFGAESGFFQRDEPVGSQFVDFDEVRKELVQIGVVWLGERNAVPVTALLVKTRSTIDDFVATIDTIRGLHVEGQDPASIQAMAREMHQQAAERLCGA